MVRSTFAKYTGCPTDMLGTSSMLDDELFVSQMDAFFSKTIYQYDVCFLQIGHHGRIGKDGNEFTEIDLEKYGKDLHHLIVFLKQYAKEVVVESIFDSIKPSKNAFVPTKLATNIRHYLMQIGFYKECPNIKINTITQWKNIKAKEVVSNISQQMGGVKWFDINNIMKQRHYVHIDHIHYEERAKKAIVKEMSKYLHI